MLLLLLALQDLTLDDGARVTRVPSVRARVKGAPGVEMSLTTDEKAAPVWKPWREITILDLPGGDGDKKVHLRLRDAGGVESAPVAAVIRLDTTPPLPKVEAPERVAGSEVRATLDVPDAVALRYTEDVRSWSSWEPYSTPKTLPLSKGAGTKALFVQFRDEAGNESAPARLLVEARSPDPSPLPAAGLRSLVLAARKVEFGIWLTLWLDGPGLTEARVTLDGTELLARTPLQPRWTFEVPRADGPRRLTVTAWDATGLAHAGEVVFQDRDAPDGGPQELEPEEDSRPWTLGMFGGFFGRGVGLDGAETAAGRRDIDHGEMFLVRVEARHEPVYPLVVGLAAEWSEGKDLHILSFGLDAGVRFDLGRWAGADLELGIEVGAYFSHLDVDVSNFGNFESAVLLRGGPRLGIRLTDALWAELQVDARWATYELEPHSFTRENEAKLADIGLWAGISWRF